jgi:hypothetical protein
MPIVGSMRRRIRMNELEQRQAALEKYKSWMAYANENLFPVPKSWWMEDQKAIDDVHKAVT